MPSSPALSRAALHALARRMRSGAIVVRDGDDEARFGPPGPAVTVTVHDPRAYRSFLAGSRGMGAAYAEGWWDCDDMVGLLRRLHVELAGPRAVADRTVAAASPVLDAVARRRRRTTPDEDRRNIRAHYDIGNDFYALMLDETMAYSCAVFERPEQTLAAAQVAKFERLCRRLRLSPDDHLLEIGTGWGGFALHAAATRGCRVTTTTISEAQHTVASKRVAEAGLADRVTVLDLDYRDLEGTYDKLVSIEMIEAVDWRDHGTFFSTCARLLAPGGLAALQAIVIADGSFHRAKRHVDFIRDQIFPGGCLPSVSSITTDATRAGLRVVGLEDIGAHYPETLRRWRENVDAASAALAELGLDRRFRRTWELYLTYCEAAFLERHVSDVHVVLSSG